MKSTPDRWPERLARAGALLLALASLTAAAATPDPDLALLGAGIQAAAHKRPADAVRDLRPALQRVPKLADYAAYSLASAEADLGDLAAALADLAPVWDAKPASPLAAEAAMLAARAYKESGKPAEGVEILRRYYSQLSQPAGDAQLASCYRAANDLASAAAYYQHVYYQYPNSGEAEQAGNALAELRNLLGQLYPPPTAQMMLARADRLAHAGAWSLARAEYQAMLSSLGGTDRDVARVRLGVVDFLEARTQEAWRYLKALEVPAGEAEAERLYYIAELARRLGRDDELTDSIHRLEQYRQSPWRLKALVTAGNRYLLDNRAEAYVPLYRACYEAFLDQPPADYCHWKVAWNAYLHRQTEAFELVREHLVKFPGSERASAALYFLGRLSEAANQPDAAKAYYTEVVNHFPNHYYADLADARLTQPAVFSAVESAEVGDFLKRLVWPVSAPARRFEPSPSTEIRIERARLLDSAGLEDLAEGELRFAARTEDQPHVVAIHLAEMAAKYGQPHRAMRLVKNLVPGYLSIPVESAPAAFWRLLYPMPWRTELERYARQHELDPYLVAGLIRQESEFNPEAVSPAQAYGLTQILPSTGRMLLKASRRRFRASVLFRPEVNLRLGTTYLRTIFDSYAGRWDLALASYNAGSTRVQNWLTWAQYREPAEFVETIPFSETRTYVFAVLRNASMYRKLYGSGAGLLAADRLSPTLKPRTGYERSPVVVKKRPHRRPVRKHRGK